MEGCESCLGKFLFDSSSKPHCFLTAQEIAKRESVVMNVKREGCRVREIK